MGGQFASVEMDHLADQIRATGVEAQVYSYIDWQRPAAAAIARYREEALKSPIIAIGHSAGRRFGDPLRRGAPPRGRTGQPGRHLRSDAARKPVPSNVARFINIYQSLNMVGGGDPLPAPTFMALCEHRSQEVLDRAARLSAAHHRDRAGVVAKVVEVTAPALQPPIPRRCRSSTSCRATSRSSCGDCGLPVIADEGDTRRRSPRNMPCPCGRSQRSTSSTPQSCSPPASGWSFPAIWHRAMPPPVVVKPLAAKKTAKAK